MADRIESGRTRIGTLDIDLRRGGDGPTILFLHPGTGLRDHDAFLDRLARKHHVVAAAHPGFDGSDNGDNFTRVADLAYFYLDLIEALDLGRPMLVGASLGAWIAAEIAVRCKHACASLVLVGPVGAKFGSEQEREIEDLFSWPSYSQDRFLFGAPALAERSWATLDPAAATAMARNFETFARLAWSPTLHNPKLGQRLARLDMPALVLRGDNDRVVSEPYCRAFAEAMGQARFETVGDAGHYAHVEQAEAVCARIEKFSGDRPVEAASRHAIGAAG